VQPDEPRLLAFSSPAGRTSPLLEVWPLPASGGYRLRFDSRIDFEVERSGQRLTVAREPGTTADDVGAFLLGPVMGLVLRLRGLACLHASAVAIKDQAIALMAPPGYGKSTLAAAFAAGGSPVLTDDILLLTEQGDRFTVWPSYPQIRLLPEAVETVFGRRGAAPRLLPSHPNGVKRILLLDGDGLRFAEAPYRLGAIYTGFESDRIAGTRIEGLSGAARFLSMCANIYLPHIADAQMHRSHFHILQRCALQIPVRCIQTPDRSRMGPLDLRDLIAEDFSRCARR
jgi:hypothetical protein